MMSQTHPHPGRSTTSPRSEELLTIIHDYEARLRAVFDAAVDAILTINEQGIIQSLNQSTEKMFGYQASELIGRNISILMPDPYAGEHNQYLQRYRATGDKRVIGIGREVTARRKDGSLFPIELAVGESDQGAQHRFTGFIRDLTERNSALEAIRRNERRFRTAFESSGIGMILATLDGQLLEVNSALANMLGYKQEELLQVEFLQLIHPEDSPFNSLSRQRLIVGEIPDFDAETRCLHRDGSVVWVHLTLSIILNESGQPAHLLGQIQNITRRKLAELRLREQAELLNLSLEAVIVRDLNDRITYWNRGAERLYGWSAEEALCRSSAEIFRGVDALQLSKVFEEVLQRGEWVGEFEHRTKTGGMIFVESHWTLLRESGGQPRGAIILNIDVTEKRELELRFLRAQRLESIGTLVSGIAHDLNNVLTPVLMAVKLLKKNKPQVDRSELLNVAQMSVERGVQMIRQLLTFTGGAGGENVPVRMTDLVKEVLTLLEHMLPKSISIRCEWPSSEGIVSGDPTQLAQVLMNLCVNARDAMPDGGILTISLMLTTLDAHSVTKYPGAKAGTFIVLGVEDTGTGIPEDVQEKMFDPFFTTKPQGQGTGLGLSTVLGIVKTHGGFINVYSETDRGTKLCVYLPTSQVLEPTTNAAIAAGSAQGHGECILIVDDEPTILMTAKATLESFGYAALTALGGEQAIELFHQHRDRIRVVLVDMMMPRIDGPAVMDTIRKASSQVAMIASSGLRPTGRYEEAIKSAGARFIAKPYSDEELIRVIAEQLARR